MSFIWAPVLPRHHEGRSHSCIRTFSRCTSLGLCIGEFQQRTTPHGEIECTGFTRHSKYLTEMHQYDDDAVRRNGWQVTAHIDSSFRPSGGQPGLGGQPGIKGQEWVWVS